MARTVQEIESEIRKLKARLDELYRELTETKAVGWVVMRTQDQFQLHPITDSGLDFGCLELFVMDDTLVVSHEEADFSEGGLSWNHPRTLVAPGTANVVGFCLYHGLEAVQSIAFFFNRAEAEQYARS